jgi:superfamily I DNA/RNA helicase
MNPDTDIAQLVASLKCGSVVAAAGCGKTEQIVRATQIAVGRRLILTHTHAGVDSLRGRLKKYKVPSEKFRIDTIAGWCLRYAASFPKRSSLPCANPKLDEDWNAVYEAAARLVQSGAVKGVLVSSYAGVLVDEYQDCSVLQHQVIKAIASHLPVCVFGDRLQAVFDFKGQKPVDWDADVFPVFGKAGGLTRPWRWLNAGNEELAQWLAGVRVSLEHGDNIDLKNRPECVRWENLPTGSKGWQAKIVGTCKSVAGKAKDSRVIVIGDPTNINARAAIAKQLAAVGFSNIEPFACKHLYEFAKRIETAKGFTRLEKTLEFICACMTGTDKSKFLSAVKSHQLGKKLGAAKFGELIKTAISVAESDSEEAVLELMQGFQLRTTTHPFRKELFFLMCIALRMQSARQHGALTDVIWEVQNRHSHSGRSIGKRSIGSTLLVKGLEFDHVVVIHADNMSRKDWYVALTRATTSVTILSPSEYVAPTA